MRLTRGTFEGPDLAALPGVSGAGEFRFVCEGGVLQVSIGSAAYVPIVTGVVSSSPWQQVGVGATALVSLIDPDVGEVQVESDVVRFSRQGTGPDALIISGAAGAFDRNVMVRAAQGFRLAKNGSWETRNLAGGGNVALTTAWAHFNKITVTGAGVATVTLPVADATTEGFFVFLTSDPASLDDLDVGPGLVTLAPGERAIVVSSVAAWEWL
jgi:hypothetical protein